MSDDPVDTVKRHIDATNRRDIDALLALTHDPLGSEVPFQRERRSPALGEPVDLGVKDRSHEGVRKWLLALDEGGRRVSFRWRDLTVVQPDTVLVQMAVDSETRHGGGSAHRSWLVFRVHEGKVDLVIDCHDEESAREAGHAASRHRPS